DASRPKTALAAGAEGLSENKIWIPQEAWEKAAAGRWAASRVGGRRQRACCADSWRILRQRSARLAEACTRALALRSAASGTIACAPSSVAFSSAHSKRSNLTMDRRRTISGDAAEPGRGSSKEKSISPAEMRSIRARKT